MEIVKEHLVLEDRIPLKCYLFSFETVCIIAKHTIFKTVINEDWQIQEMAKYLRYLDILQLLIANQVTQHT